MKYPMDTEHLQKGQVLDIPTLEAIFGQRYDISTDWDLQLMKLQGIIHADRADITVVIDRDRLRVLTDAEASEHNMHLVARGARLIVSRNERLLGVDRGQLTVDESNEHDRRVLVSAALAAGVSDARRRIVALPSDSLPRRSRELVGEEVE